ncbi:MAG: universal stress protein [Ilumatobacteraceae bacterium]
MSAISRRRILVSIECDDRGKQALSWGRIVAAEIDGELVGVLQVMNTSAEHSRETAHEFAEQTATSARSWAAACGARLDDVCVVEGALQDELVELAGVDDLVVVGVDHQVGATGWALGSLPHELAHHLACPLVLIPPDEIPALGSQVIVGVDGSEANDQVVSWAKRFAQTIRCPLVAIYAREPIYETFDNAGNYGGEERHAVAEAQDDSVSLVEMTGEPEDVLRAYAHDHATFLTVIGVRDRGSLHGRLLGAVADHVIHEPYGPTAIIPDGLATTPEQ